MNARKQIASIHVDFQGFPPAYKSVTGKSAEGQIVFSSTYQVPR